MDAHAIPFKGCEITTKGERHMSLPVSDFVDIRIDEIAQELRRTNGEYALAMDRRKDLYSNLDSIIMREESVTICVGDCLDFQEFFEQDFVAAALLQKELYRQGCRDAVELLRQLHVLA